MDENVSLFLVKVRGPYVDRMTFITESDFSFVYSWTPCWLYCRAYKTLPQCLRDSFGCS